MHKEGLEAYNDFIKISILLFCTAIRQDKEFEITIIELYIITLFTCMSPCCHNNLYDQLNYNFRYSLNTSR